MAKQKVFIEVRGGMIQNIQSTSEDVIIYVKDYDEEGHALQKKEEIGWPYWESRGGDQVVDEATFEDAIVNANN